MSPAPEEPVCADSPEKLFLIVLLLLLLLILLLLLPLLAFVMSRRFTLIHYQRDKFYFPDVFSV